MDTNKSIKRSLQLYDPVGKQSERDFEQVGLSPMDPPEAYAPPNLEAISAVEMHPFLAHLATEHTKLTEALDTLEGVLSDVKSNGFSTQADHAIMRFLEVFDHDFVPHSQEEEDLLFPLLHTRLVEDGEHSKGGKTVTTAVHVMCNEHRLALQHASVMMNFVRMGTCLPDERSAQMVIDAGLREAEKLVELLRLHMFREDNIVFVSAQRLISKAELDGFCARSKRGAAKAASGEEVTDEWHEHPHEH